MARPFLILLILLLAAPAAQAEPWIITDEVRCTDDELVLRDHLIIRDGGSLVLEDCHLVVDSPSYENVWLNAPDEGLRLLVEEGGRLEVRSVDSGSSIRPAQLAYGYTMRVDGDLLVEGTEQAPVVIERLEGFMAEALVGGGLRVTGNATLQHVDFQNLFGPALFALSGGSVQASDISVRNSSGAFVSNRAEMALERVDVNVGIEGIRVTRSEFTMRDSVVMATRVALHSTLSNLTLEDVELVAINVGLGLSDSDATLTGSRIGYGLVGIEHIHKADRGDLDNQVLVHDTLVEPRWPGNSTAVIIQGASLELSGSVLRNYTVGGVAVYKGHDVHLHDNVFDGGGSYHAYLTEPRSVSSGGNRFLQEVPQPYILARPLMIHVTEGGVPVPGASIEVDQGEGTARGTTDANGTLGMRWSTDLHDDGSPVHGGLTIKASSGGKSRTVDVGASDSEVVIDLDARASNGIPAVAPVGLVAALGLAVALRRERLR